MNERILMRRIQRGLAVALATFTVAACATPNEPGQNNNNQNVPNPNNPNNGNASGLNINFRPSNPGAGWVPAATAAERQSLINTVWSTLSAPACWDATSVLPVGHVSQFQFFGQNEYRHFGFTINFGAVFLHDIGRYQGYDTAIVETWTGEVEALVVVSRNVIAHLFPHLDGKTITVLQYGGSNGPCL